MTMLGFSISSPAGIILQYLQRHGPATIKELEDVLGVSTTAVREHVAHLHAKGLIAMNAVRRGLGRPHFVYTLTDKAHSLFPKRYNQLINLLLREIMTLDGHEKVDQLLERVSKHMASEYTDHVRGENTRTRLETLRVLLEAKGIPTELHDSEHEIVIFACPYFDVAQEHPAVCKMELHMLEKVLGEKVSLTDSIRDGNRICRFVIRDTS